MKDAENFMNKNYRVALQYDPDGYWIATHPELSGCMADGETAQEALSSLEISRELWIECSLANGLEVPEPQEPPQYSGRFVLRIPKSLHRDLANEAEAEGVSLNSFISNVLAGRHTRKEQHVSFVPQQAEKQAA
jgi:predicted RNase H-like HicB family nuclease